MSAKAIYLVEMPSTAWQLLWWLISQMDDKCEVRDGWRIAAARALKKDRTWIQKCAEVLQERGLIETAPRKRYARVIAQNIVG